MRYTRWLVTAGLAAALFVPAVAGAWGANGHRIVCDIAWRRLTPEARTLVETLRAGDAVRTESFAGSCSWADGARRSRPETSAYHYVNIPAGVAGLDMARDCATEAKCVPWAIEHYAEILADTARPVAERAEALRFLSHFVGDVHQPLHAGRPEDRGGNTIHVSFLGDPGPANRPFNLHYVWDDLILRHADVVGMSAAAALDSAITPDQARAWAASSVAEWTDESYRMCETDVYPLPAGNAIDEAYYQRALADEKTRLEQAGVRLATVLNEIAAGERPEL